MSVGLGSGFDIQIEYSNQWVAVFVPVIHVTKKATSVKSEIEKCRDENVLTLMSCPMVCQLGC